MGMLKGALQVKERSELLRNKLQNCFSGLGSLLCLPVCWSGHPASSLTGGRGLDLVSNHM